VEFKDIKFNLYRAIDLIIARDSYLLIHDINEPTISHRLAMYLTPIFPDFDVDCEYNGNIDAKSGRKYINLLQTRAKELGLIKNNDSDKQIIDRLVYPDIIVHRRGQNGKENNLLIIEVKKSSSQITDEWDCEKLSRFTSKEYENNYDYCFGVFVRFGVRNHCCPK